MLVSLKQISELFQCVISVYFTCKHCLCYNAIHNFHNIRLTISWYSDGGDSRITTLLIVQSCSPGGVHNIHPCPKQDSIVPSKSASQKAINSAAFADFTYATNRQTDRQTDTQTDHAKCNMCSNSRHLCMACRRCGLMTRTSYSTMTLQLQRRLKCVYITLLAQLRTVSR